MSSEPLADPWKGSKCPICPREWPVESIRQQCLTEHGPVARPGGSK